MRTQLSSLIISFIFVSICVSITNSEEFRFEQPTQMGIKSFGMNKPHLLFHLGTRDPISVNYGFGYWLNSPKNNNSSYFTRERLWYENTKNGLYVNMICHDGQSHIHQEIKDSLYGVKSDIKYQLKEKYQPSFWQQAIQISKSKLSNESQHYENHSVYWFSYITVENNDPSKVDKKQYATPITLEIQAQDSNSVQILVNHVSGQDEKILIKSKQKLNIFGFSMNISESYDIRSSIAEVKHLIELERYNNVARKKDKDLVEWQNSQVKLIKKNDWIGKKYVVLVAYGQFSTKNQIFVTNQTKRETFDSQYFNQKTKYLVEKQYFPSQIYQEHAEFLRHMIFNLYGGQAFYYGILYTQNSLLNHQLDFSYTFTPSRLIFPRGFLWDDGFHMSVAVHHNSKIVLNVIHNWLKKIDLFGWIGREQIRGYEMSSLMPEIKFVYQDIFEMNPPTLILPILTLIEKSKDNELSKIQKQYFDELIAENYWKLQKWYRYLMKTQSHYNLMEQESINKTIKYRWRCKDDCERGNFMGSGLDDYPRISQNGQISKQHIDLISWLYFFSDGLQQIASYLGKYKNQKFYAQKKQQLTQKIMKQCLDEEDLLFKDLSVAGKAQFINEHVSKKGYINLFPFFTGMLQEESYDEQNREKIRLIFQATLNIMSDEKQLLSEDGLRSLSKSDMLYGTEDNYWRGAVWMPINYMVLRSCKKYYWNKRGVAEFYYQLRRRLIKTVKNNYQKSGYLYQNYHLGAGNRGYPFYGWTTLLVNIISQKY